MEPAKRTLPNHQIFCSSTSCVLAVTKFLIVTGIAVEIIGTIAYGTKKISREDALIVVIAGTGVATISALAYLINAIFKHCLKNEDEYESSLSLDSSSPLLISPRLSFEKGALLCEHSLDLTHLISLEDLEWENIPLEKAQGIFEEYQKEKEEAIGNFKIKRVP